MSDVQKNNETIWTPSNVITITRILLVPVFVAALLCPWPEWLGLPDFGDQWKRIVAAAIFVLISGTDWLDGFLARKYDQVTDFGKFMDPLADKILVTAALIALVELDALPTWVVLIILAREFIVSGVRMMAATKGVVIAASWLGKMAATKGVVIAASWLGKSKTVSQMIAIVLFTIKDSHADIPISQAMADPLWLFSWIVMIVAIVLTIASLIDYLYKARVVIGLVKSDSEKERLVKTISDAEDCAVEVVSKLEERGWTLATAESLTGGLIGSCITSVPGSSVVYKGAVVSYVNEVKHGLLGVGEDVLDSDGAVSEKCALQMAEGARKALNTDIAISVTGIAGPGGEEPGKPVGTVWMGVSTEKSLKARMFTFEGSRQEVRVQTVSAAFDAILERIQAES